MRIRINQTAPAGAIERPPLTFRLRQAIGDRIDRLRRPFLAKNAEAELQLSHSAG